MKSTFALSLLILSFHSAVFAKTVLTENDCNKVNYLLFANENKLAFTKGSENIVQTKKALESFCKNNKSNNSIEMYQLELQKNCPANCQKINDKLQLIVEGASLAANSNKKESPDCNGNVSSTARDQFMKTSESNDGIMKHVPTTISIQK